MEVTRKEIVNAVLNNDVNRVAEILEAFHLTKNAADSPYLTPTSKEIAVTMLSIASAMDWRDNLSKALAMELIERLATVVDIFQFLQLVAVVEDIGEYSYDEIPEEILETLRSGEYNDEVAREINDMDEYLFEILISFLVTGDIEHLHNKFNTTLLRCVGEKTMTPAHLTLSYMALCLHSTIDDHLDELCCAIGGFAMLGILIDGMSDDGEDRPKNSGQKE